MFDFRSWWRGKGSEYCTRDFPEVWTAFVDSFVDSILARGPAARPHFKVPPHPTFLPAAARIVAIGDLHGDLHKARRAFRVGGLIDQQDHWIGGSTTAVQVGDQLDRGDHELEILYFLERLQREAARAGGALHILNGNHETMNVAGRFRYATLPGIADFYRWEVVQSIGAGLKARCGCAPDGPLRPTPVGGGGAALEDAAERSRQHALAPGGAVTRRFLAPHPVALQVGSTVFVHGGILPEHAEYGLERLNADCRAWMEGVPDAQMPVFLGGRRAVVWARDYSNEDERQCDCSALAEALGMLPGAQRMVVGHTIQDAGINSACGGRVLRIDVGLSAGCGDGDPQVLEILNDSEVRRLHEGQPPAPLPSGLQESPPPEPVPRVPFWQWAAKQRQDAPPPPVLQEVR
ncbi:hypothetical protein WJX81_001287 [Elliptochloris bilobata]|uniref:Calcineurin-like phosphoesterase domain-containing protein n=1 Tax=Elliptochloris bilobata TaxID=381761 RepID=A0AAW1QVD7_9CHLO